MLYHLEEMSPSKLVFLKAKVISGALIEQHELAEMTVRDEMCKVYADNLISKEMALDPLNYYEARAITFLARSTSLHWLKFDGAGLSDLSSRSESGAISDGLGQDKRASGLFNLGRNAAILLIKTSQINDCEMNLAISTSIISERYSTYEKDFKVYSF